MIMIATDTLTRSPQITKNGDSCHTQFCEVPDLPEYDIAALRAGMTTNALQRADRKESLRSAKADAYVAEADPARWDAEYAALVAAGIDDINIDTRRISGYGQGDGYGLDAQARAIRAFIVMKEAQTEGLLFPRKAADLSIVDVDSGKEESRVGMEWIREKVKEGRIRGVIAYKGDRVARNVLYSETLQREFKARGCRIWSATEDIPDNAYGNCFRQVLAVFAELELSLIAGRLSNGRKEMVKQTGGYLGGGAPYGYEIVGTRWDSGKGVIVVCEAEARVVILIFDLYARGYNQTAIAEFLNRCGIPTRHDARAGWGQSIVRHILIRERGYRAEGLFNAFASDFQTQRHAPILPGPRAEADRVYLIGSVKSTNRLRVPDNPTATPIVLINGQNTLEVLDPHVAEGLALAITYLQRGMALQQITDALNLAGYVTPKGRPWKKSNLAMHLHPDRRERLLGAISSAGGTSAPATALPMTPEQAERSARSAQELRGIDRIGQVHTDQPELSMRKITETINAEGFLTVDGKPWQHQMIARVLKGVPRQSQIGAAKALASPAEPPKLRYMEELSDSERTTAGHVKALYATGLYSMAALAALCNDKWPHPRADQGRTWTASDIRQIVRGLNRWKQTDEQAGGA